MSAQNTIREIEQAFWGVARPETSLRQFKLTDEFGMSGNITDADWLRAGSARVDASWLDIPDAEIEECGNQLAHMQADEFLYYLPAYMCYAVRQIARPIWETDIIGSLVFSLSPKSQMSAVNLCHFAQLTLINKAQKNAVINFLQFIGVMADAVHQSDAINAIERYWNHSEAIESAAKSVIALR
jgi:hypothetical protein